MFGMAAGGGGFSNSSSATSGVGDGGEIGGMHFGGINNGSRLPEWIPFAIIGLVVVLIIKK